MINKRKALLAGLVCLSAASLASCKPEEPTGQWTNTDFVDTSVQVSAAQTGSLENFVASSYEERAEILGLLEQYAMENGLTGIVLYDDGGYVKYSDRLVIPTAVKKNPDGSDMEIAGTKQHEYVTSYGFGILADGAKKPGTNSADPYDNYYKTFETSDPQTLNYMNDKGEIVGGLQPYVSMSYFDARLTASKDSYEWYPSAASDANTFNGQPRPIPQNFDEASGLATKYRIYVRTDVKYNTAGKLADKYKGTTVKLEDYVTPWKELHNQSNGLVRATDNFGTAAEIVGLQDYYNATANGHDQAAWDKVGLKTGTDDKGSYLEVEFKTPCSPFYAMYYTNSSLYSPIPKAFLDEIGGIRVWESSNSDGTLTPVDTTLSTGPYVLSKWETNKEIVFSANELCSAAVKGGENRYTIPGVHIAIFEAATKDPLAAWNEYEKGNFDAVGIPLQKLAQEKGTAGTQVTKGSSTTKLNVNTCTEKEWEKLFGENGTVTQTPKNGYWPVEPAMSNEDFILGLNLSIDRQEYADKRGVVPSCSYFSDAYMSNPETGVSYNSTEAHKNALEAVYGDDVETYGYNLNAAAEAFARAAEKLIADGVYKAGDTIEIEMAWQTETNIEKFGKDIEAYIKEAWELAETGLNLEIKHWTGATWSDVYYKKMMLGQFDIGFGGISGNTFNPLNFMEVLKSDNSSGFTLNWGPDTNDPSALIEYDGKKFTYDALWKAADTGALVDGQGRLANNCDAALVSNVKNEGDNSRTVVIKVAMSNITGVCSTEIASVVLFWNPDSSTYDEVEVTNYTYDAQAGTITFTISAEQAEAYQGFGGVDVYFTSPELGDSLVSCYHELPVWEEPEAAE